FRAPEERQLLLDQLLEDGVFLLVIAGDVDRLAEEHRLVHLVVVGLGKGAVFHFHAGPSWNLQSVVRVWGWGVAGCSPPSPQPLSREGRGALVRSGLLVCGAPDIVKETPGSFPPTVTGRYDRGRC